MGSIIGSIDEQSIESMPDHYRLLTEYTSPYLSAGFGLVLLLLVYSLALFWPLSALPFSTPFHDPVGRESLSFSKKQGTSSFSVSNGQV